MCIWSNLNSVVCSVLLKTPVHSAGWGVHAVQFSLYISMFIAKPYFITTLLNDIVQVEVCNYVKCHS